VFARSDTALAAFSFSIISSTVNTCAKANPSTAQVARCNSPCGTPPMSEAAVPSLRKKTRKSRTQASRAVMCAHTLLAMPVTITLSLPRARRMSSRSVAWNAPKRGFSSDAPSGRTDEGSDVFVEVQTATESDGQLDTARRFIDRRDPSSSCGNVYR
jgi:hypothetical protein